MLSSRNAAFLSLQLHLTLSNETAQSASSVTLLVCCHRATRQWQPGNPVRCQVTSMEAPLRTTAKFCSLARRNSSASPLERRRSASSCVPALGTHQTPMACNADVACMRCNEKHTCSFAVRSSSSRLGRLSGSLTLGGNIARTAWSCAFRHRRVTLAPPQMCVPGYNQLCVLACQKILAGILTAARISAHISRLHLPSVCPLHVFGAGHVPCDNLVAWACDVSPLFGCGLEGQGLATADNRCNTYTEHVPMERMLPCNAVQCYDHRATSTLASGYRLVTTEERQTKINSE
jgi:hypothetical protein